MTAVPPPTPPRGGRSRALIVWLVSLLVVITGRLLDAGARLVHLPTGLINFTTFLAVLVFIAMTLYWIAIAIRWMLRKIFWSVGRRLFLSYILIGVLPFFLMAILMLCIGYMGFGVMAHAALRNERQASLGQMESWSLSYGLTGTRPREALPTLEIYDTARESGAKMPEWLKETTFSGIVTRTGVPFLVTSRQMVNADGSKRSIVFAQPLDRNWSDSLFDKSGMIARVTGAKETHRQRAAGRGNHSISLDSRDDDNTDYDIQPDDEFSSLVMQHVGRDIVWGDLTPLTDWDTGETTASRDIFTLIIIPIRNLFQFYFGSSGLYMRALVNIILGLTVALFLIYFVAALFAAVLIFSISRAVNRIEKGTKAVERGDFSYRIAMKPHNQLGAMARSFDRMTESVASLLANVAEKERLQSEIAIAASIQRNLLPKEGPHFRGVSFSAHFEPTASIGGDYYDVFNLDKTRLAVAIGDVSGHGLSTGLVMAMVKAAITTLVEEGAEETSLFNRLNELVYRSTERRAFMTLGFTIFDLQSGSIRHTNAGHLYPYLLRKGEAPRPIESPSFPLGVRADITTRTVEVDLQEGDAIVYLSDGIVEAQDPDGDPFGFEALEDLLARETDRSPSVIRDSILNAVARHSGNRPADDDRTLMVLRFDNFRTSISVPASEIVDAAAVPA